MSSAIILKFTAYFLIDSIEKFSKLQVSVSIITAYYKGFILKDVILSFQLERLVPSTCIFFKLSQA